METFEETWILGVDDNERNTLNVGACTSEKTFKFIQGGFPKMNKKLLKVAVTSALTVAFAVPAFANPFVDVSKDHWAYDAVVELAKEGVIEGYGDNTFRGEQNITRYEMAQMVAKAMDQDLTGEQKATVEKLAREFAKELNSLGKDVKDLKAEQERVKISGDARVRYGSNDESDKTDFRARVTLDGKISDNLKFNTRVSSGDISYDENSEGIVLDTANLSFNALGLENTVGRQDLILGTGTIIDDTMTGISSEVGGLKVFYGNHASEEQDLFGAEYGTELFGADVNLDYMKADAKQGEDKEFYGVNTSFGITKNISMNAEYAKENKSGDDAVAYGIKFDKLGLSATYKDVEAGAATNYGAQAYDINNVSFLSEGYKGMEYKLERELNENTLFTVKYQDFENHAGTKDDNRTSAYLNVKF